MLAVLNPGGVCGTDSGVKYSTLLALWALCAPDDCASSRALLSWDRVPEGEEGTAFPPISTAPRVVCDLSITNGAGLGIGAEPIVLRISGNGGKGAEK